MAPQRPPRLASARHRVGCAALELQCLSALPELTSDDGQRVEVDGLPRSEIDGAVREGERFARTAALRERFYVLAVKQRARIAKAEAVRQRRARHR